MAPHPNQLDPGKLVPSLGAHGHSWSHGAYGHSLSWLASPPWGEGGGGGGGGLQALTETLTVVVLREALLVVMLGREEFATAQRHY